MKNNRLKSGFNGLLTLISCFSINVYSQSLPVNFVGWYTYDGYHTVNKANNLAIVLEGTIQRNNIIIEPIQYAYSAGLSYEFKNQHRVAGSYEFQYNFPYDAASVPYNAVNRRVWEQYTFRKSYNRFSHRFRLEQIWTQQKSPPSYDTTTDWKFQNVLRYRINYVLPINSKFEAEFNDEIFLNLYDLKSQRMLNQNRIYAGLIFNLDTAHIWKMNAGYMFQSVWNTNESKEDRKRINNVLRVSIISDLSFYKKKAVIK